MKTSIDYLPKHKQDELQRIVAIISDTKQAEMLILFGSYARGDWVEDKYDDTHFRYQSDMDLLVIVETRSDSAQEKLELAIETDIRDEPAITTPVSIIVHDIDFVNRRLRKGQYFFSDIEKEGVLLIGSEHHTLATAKQLPPAERKRLAEADFEYYFKDADGFKKGVLFYLDENEFKKAAFLLHQTAERLYTAILLVFTRYKPNTHDIAILRELANSLDNALIPVFPMNNTHEHHLFKLLRKAYVDGRYKPSYKISHKQLTQLIDKVDKLKTIGDTICRQKIDSFVEQ